MALQSVYQFSYKLCYDVLYNFVKLKFMERQGNENTTIVFKCF